MIHFFIGTKAQLIKMAPIMIELKRQNISFRYIDSGQHAEFTRSIRKVFGLEEPDICLVGNKKDIASVISAVGWLVKLIMILILKRKWLRNTVYCGGGICLIHGDTLSTLLGMKIGKNSLVGGVIKDPCVTEFGENITMGEYAIIYGHILNYNDGKITISKVKIGNNCVIGAGSIIMPGAVLKDNIILAAGAVVSQNQILEENKTYGGIPAKEIKNKKK